VPVQMTAPAVVIRNTMAGVELEPACDAHGRTERSAPDYNKSGILPTEEPMRAIASS
jgi:hypothetical protein